jgi:hypothetical protein
LTVVWQVLKTFVWDLYHHSSFLKPPHIRNWFYFNLQVSRVQKKTYSVGPLSTAALTPWTVKVFQIRYTLIKLVTPRTIFRRLLEVIWAHSNWIQLQKIRHAIFWFELTFSYLPWMVFDIIVYIPDLWRLFMSVGWEWPNWWA